jgi:hypothetical protein
MEMTSTDLIESTLGQKLLVAQLRDGPEGAEHPRSYNRISCVTFESFGERTVRDVARKSHTNGRRGQNLHVKAVKVISRGSR